MMDNKRGILPLIPLTVGGLIVVAVFLLFVLGGTFAFISFNKFLVIGATIIVLTFVFAVSNAFKGNLTRNKVLFMIFLFLIGVVVAFAPQIGLVEESVLDYTVVYKQNWGNICCVQEDDYDIVYDDFLENKNLWVCNHYTNICEVEIKNTESDWLSVANSGHFQLCDISGNNCEYKQKYTIGPSQRRVLPTLNVGESYKFTTGYLTSGEDTSLITLKAKSFYIKGLENGKVYRQESCVLSDELEKRVLSGGLNELSKIGANSCQNYMIDFVQVATKTYSYEGQEVICQARQIYSIDNKRFLDGKLSKVQGDLIKSVECCPTEANCDADSFTFIEDDRKRCTYSSECPNGGNPVATGSNTYVTYDCVGGWCDMSSEKIAECTNTAECIRLHGSDYVCDLSPGNWGNCKKSTAPRHCGDGTCDSVDGENFDTCPADCSLDCPDGTVLEITVEKDFWGKETVVKKCVSTSLIKPWMWFVGVACVMFIVILLLIKPKRNGRGYR